MEVAAKTGKISVESYRLQRRNMLHMVVPTTGITEDIRPYSRTELTIEGITYSIIYYVL